MCQGTDKLNPVFSPKFGVLTQFALYAIVPLSDGNGAGRTGHGWTHPAIRNGYGQRAKADKLLTSQPDYNGRNIETVCQKSYRDIASSAAAPVVPLPMKGSRSKDIS